ncbi:hypothetical protein ABZ848_20200 [Streptomyces sp. NPDC047081]
MTSTRSPDHRVSRRVLVVGLFPHYVAAQDWALARLLAGKFLS